MSDDKPIVLRGHHLSAVMEEMYNPGLMTDDSTIKEYGEKNVREARRLINIILNENVDVTLVDTLDDMCVDCLGLNRDKDCSGLSMSEYDQDVASKYGLETGKTYSSFEIRMKIRRVQGDEFDC